MENFKPNSPSSQPEKALSREEELMELRVAAIDEAKIRAEGVILYAPIPNDVKERLLQALATVPARDERSIELEFARDESASMDEEAARYVDHRIRLTVQEVARELPDGRTLQLAFDALLDSDKNNKED